MVMPSTVTDEVCNREKTESNLQVRTVRPVLNYTEYDQYIDHIHGNMNIREMNCQRKEDSLKEKKKKRTERELQVSGSQLGDGR